MADKISLCCSILGPDVGHVFSVKVSRDEIVDVLKKVIKEEKGNAFNRIDADQLEIWKVSDRAQRTRHY